MLNIPQDITLKNVAETLTIQDPELYLKEGGVRAKFCYTTKQKTRNLVIEVDSGTRKNLMQARIKLGWSICSVDDYIAKRCFRCSRYNHDFRDCKGEETCPLWTGSHKLKECNAIKSEHKCINCMAYNKHHQTSQIDTAHSSLDKNCPSLPAVLENTSKTRATNMAAPQTQKMKTRNYTQHHIRCNQVNLQHSRAATDNLMQIISAERIRIALIQEPYLYQNRTLGITKGYKTFTSGEGKSRAAIVIPDNRLSSHYTIVRQ
jgi:hypothetical protein